MADKFAPGFEFGVPVRAGAKPPVAEGPVPGVEFGTPVPSEPDALPPAPPRTGTPFAMRPGEAGFGAPGIPAGYEGPPLPERSDVRMLAEGGGAAAGETLARRFGGPLATPAGAAAGGFAGSLLANLYDPVKEPLRTAAEAGAMSAAATVAAAGGLAAMRHAVGKPNEAGKWLIAQMEKDGRVPPAGAIFPDSSLITNIQSVAQADIVAGQHVKQLFDATRGRMTDELRDYLNHYLRVKVGADRVFSRVDRVIANTVGSKGVVQLPEHVWDTTRDLVKGWKSRGLHKSDAMIASLVEKVEAAEARAASDTLVKFEPPLLSFREADALGDRFREAAAAAQKGTASQREALAGVDYGRAYTQFAREVEKSFDDSVSAEIKSGTLPLELKAELQGARTLWRQWRSGKTMRDHVMKLVEASGREGGPVTSGNLFSAITKIVEDVDGRAVTKQQIGYLTGIARALAQAEKAETQKAFTWVVRAGQLGVLLNQASVLGGREGVPGIPTGQEAFIVLSPAVLAFLTTNPRSVRWMIEGMKTEGGTAHARRLGKQLFAAMAKEGLFAPDRAGLGAEQLLVGPEAQEFAAPLVARPPAAPQRNPSLPGVDPAFRRSPPVRTIPPRLDAAPRG